MPFSAEDFAAQLEERLQRAADPKKVMPMASYMKDNFPFLGVQSVPRREVFRAWLATLPKLNANQTIALAQALWDRDPRECQYAASDLLTKYKARLEAQHLPALQALIADKPWWDTVDALAAHPLGHLVQHYPSLAPQMDQWIEHPLLWIRRAALLHQLNYKQNTDWKRLQKHCLALMPETDFFARKAIGWALRQYARVDAKAVYAFVDKHPFASLTVREACKHRDS